MKTAANVDLLMARAFDQRRDVRSDEYRAGARAALSFRLLDAPVACPHAAGTAQCDAFWAGHTEGMRIWRNLVSAVAV